MASEQFVNGSQTTLSAAINDSTTTITVVSAEGFPSTPRFRIRIDKELLLVTGGAGTSSWNVTRGIEGTPQAAHSDRALVSQVLTAGALASITWKSPCRAATTDELPDSTRTGNVLTANDDGALPNVDGVALAAKDRLLVKDEGEGTSADNGLYFVSNLGDENTPWTLTRCSDADDSAEVVARITVPIEEGAVNGNTFWTLTTNNPIVLNATELTFESLLVLPDHDHTESGDGGVLNNDRHDGFSEYAEISAPSTPASNTLRLYAKDKSGKSELFYKNDAGDERDLSTGGGGSLPTTTKGDLIVHNGTTNVRLAVGSNGQALVADSAQSTGIKWATSFSVSGSVSTFNGPLVCAENLRLQANSPSEITSNQNDYDPGLMSFLRLRCDEDGTRISGISGGADGRILRLLNIGANH